jgi:glycosyltransferase involved in cell wall biosynthesis
VEELLSRLRAVINSNQELFGACEIVFVDDGSTDNSQETLKCLLTRLKGSPQVRAFFLKNHVGKAVALQCGIEQARGKFFVFLDADLQDPPEACVALLKQLGDGTDAVIGWRKGRRDTLWRKFVSLLANHIRRQFLGETAHDVGCALRACHRAIFDGIYLHGGFHRFFTTIVRKRGYRLAEIEVPHEKRRYGESRYGTFDRLFESLPELLEILGKPIETVLSAKPQYEIVEEVRSHE